MNKIHNYYILKGMLCISMLFVFGCAATGISYPPANSAIASEGILRVGVTANAPPLIFRKGEKIQGLEADLAQELGTSLGKSVQFVDLKWEDLIPALLENKIDIIMSGLSITKTRRVRIAFTEPYLNSGLKALIRATDLSKYPSLIMFKYIKGTRVGVEKGTTADLLVQQVFRNTERVLLSSPEKAARALVKEKIDVFIHDAPVIWWLAAEKESDGLIPVPKFLSREGIAWAVRYEDKDLLDSANGFISKWKNDGRLKAIINQWIPYAFK
jgi:polar amino acid transport system substrate-binding protein